MQGMIISVYRTSNFGNCTNGPTAESEEVLLVGDNVPKLFEAKGRPVFKLKKTMAGQVVAVPFEMPDGRYPQFGGNFISSSDSRFGEAARALDPNWRDWTIPVFDRDESQPFDRFRYFAYTANHEEKGLSLPRNFVAKVECGVEGDSAFEMILCSEIGDAATRDGDVFSDESKGVTLRPIRETPLTYQDFQVFCRSGVEQYEVTLSSYSHWAIRRGDLDAAVIYFRREDKSGYGESGYWNERSQTWGNLQLATRYSRNERRLKHHMPRLNVTTAVFDGPQFIDVASIKQPAVVC